MLTALLISAVLQAAGPETPAWSSPTTLSAEEAGACVAQNLRGKRLGLNIMTLRPARYVLDGAEVIEVGPAMRFVIEPAEGGATIRLYAKAWEARLASFVRPCVTTVAA